MAEYKPVFWLILIITLIFSAPFVWYIVTIKSSVGFILPEHTDAWIGFFGSIIGGALTLFGVLWTINAQEKQRREDIKDSFLPIPVIFSISQDNSEIIENTINVEFEMIIKNIGKGPMLKIKFDEVEPYFIIIDNTKYVPNDYGFDTPSCLDTNETFPICFPKIKIKIYDIYSEYIYFSHFEYIDAFDRKYNFYIKVTYKCHNEGNGGYTTGIKSYCQVDEKEYRKFRNYHEIIVQN